MSLFKSCRERDELLKENQRIMTELGKQLQHFTKIVSDIPEQLTNSIEFKIDDLRTRLEKIESKIDGVEKQAKQPVVTHSDESQFNKEAAAFDLMKR